MSRHSVIASQRSNPAFARKLDSVAGFAMSIKNIIMEIGFIGLGKMGFPMARRLIEAGHQLIVFDTRKEAVDKLVALGARPRASPKEVADRVETVHGEPAVAAGLARGRDRRRRRDRGQAGQTLHRSLHRRLADGGADSRSAGEEEHRADRQPRLRRRRRRREGHAGGDGVGPEGRVRGGEIRARRHRQGVLHRRKARLRRRP